MQNVEIDLLVVSDVKWFALNIFLETSKVITLLTFMLEFNLIK